MPRKKALFICYYFDDLIGVGSLRVSYWAHNILRVSNNEISCDVLTTGYDLNAEQSSIENIIRVENNGNSVLGLLIKDEGVNWKSCVKTYIKRNLAKSDYDWVILTGGPFMHFELTSFLKDFLKCKVILDFRDPFSDNPKFNDGFLKKTVKRYFERSFVAAANCVITVNEDCASLMRFPEIALGKYHIIENGYNEQIIDSISMETNEQPENIQFIYAGKIYDDAPPELFLSIISDKVYSSKFSFTHIGDRSEIISRFEHFKNITFYETKPYDKVIEDISKAQIGLVFTGGKPFDSTTKVFDYIGLNKPVLIITNGELQTGNLHRITENYPKVYWSKNLKDNIQKALELIASDTLEFSFANREEYSRENGLVKLIELIDN